MGTGASKSVLPSTLLHSEVAGFKGIMMIVIVMVVVVVVDVGVLEWRGREMRKRGTRMDDAEKRVRRCAPNGKHIDF